MLDVQHRMRQAIAAGDIAACEAVLADDANVLSDMGHDARPPLWVACGNNDLSMVEWLLAQRVPRTAHAGSNPTHWAFELPLARGHTAIATRLFTGARSAFNTDHCGTALIALARGPHDDLDMAALILSCCDAKRIKAIDYACALEQAAFAGHEKLVGMLLAGKASLETVMPAARGGWPVLVQRLADLGASTSQEDRRSGETPLHVAVQAPRNAAETVETLLRLGCRHNRPRLDGKTPAVLALSIGRDDLAALIAALSPQCGPTWMREARQRGIDHYVFSLSRDRGLGFNPNDLERPVLFGGTQDGFGWEQSADAACKEIAAGQSLPADVNWFIPYLQKLAGGEDFSLKEMEAAGGPWTAYASHDESQPWRAP